VSGPDLQPRLRRPPLQQYLVRGLGADATRQEALRALRAEHAAVVPLSGGPFNLFGFERHCRNLEDRGIVGEAELARCFEAGIEVELGEPRGSGGKIDGRIDRGRVRVVLNHEPEPPAPADWRLVAIRRSPSPARVIARLECEWISAGAGPGGGGAGVARTTLEALAAVFGKYASRRQAWAPPTIDAGRMILHFSEKVKDHPEVEALRGGLYGRRAELLVHDLLEPSKGAMVPGVALLWPGMNRRLGLYPARFADAGPEDWFLEFVEPIPPSTTPLAHLEIRGILEPKHPKRPIWGVNARWWEEVRRVSGERRRWEADRWEEARWVAHAVKGGPFRLRVGDEAASRRLRRDGHDAGALCERMSAGLGVVRLTGPESEVIEAAVDGTDLRLSLEPHRPAAGRGVGDWWLDLVEPARSSGTPFARVVASWHTGASRVSAGGDTGDATVLLRELGQLQARREQVVREFARIFDPPADLKRRVEAWRYVCQLERDLLQIGVARLTSRGTDYSVVPKDRMAVAGWVEKLKEHSPEGVDWARQSLRLQVGGDHAILKLLGEPAAGVESADLALHVRCDSDRGRMLLDRLCAGSNPGGDAAGVRLYPANTQLKLIERALDAILPGQSSRGPGWEAGAGTLVMGDQTLRTLQYLLAEPRSLPPVARPWPGLRKPPLDDLSEAQEEAIRAALHGPDVTLIQGPPGTGKTTVILELLRQLFLAHGKDPRFRVLLVAPTHVAVDNVLERLVAPRKGGVNLVTELGVTPYRLGKTRAIAEPLRGVTLDCFNTAYCQELEQGVARAAAQARAQIQADRRMHDELARGAADDAIAWSVAARGGGLPPPGAEPAWPDGLPGEWRDAVRTQDGRARAWREWAARGGKPEGRVDLLERWLAFLRKEADLISGLLLADANLICATTIGCATHPDLRDATYDYVIVDEAGKEEARRLLVPLVRGDRWVLVGDHQQLPPFADRWLLDRLRAAGQDTGLLTRSLFEELQDPLEARGTYVFLDRQGRMDPDISAFVSERFYDGRLLDFPRGSRRLPAPSFLPDRPALAVLDTRLLPDRARMEVAHRPGFDNPAEREVALHIVRAFARLPDWESRLADRSRPDRLSVGVIAPYGRQVEALRRGARRDPLLRPLLDAGTLHIGTVDGFQGQERDLIVFTCTRSNPRGDLGFLDDRQRLNVALSRARSRLVVLVDGSTVERAVRRGDVAGVEAETRDHLAALLAHARGSGGLVAVPTSWRTRWKEGS